MSLDGPTTNTVAPAVAFSQLVARFRFLARALPLEVSTLPIWLATLRSTKDALRLATVVSRMIHRLGASRVLHGVFAAAVVAVIAQLVLQ